MELAAGKCRLDEVRRICRPFGGACAYDRMELIDEEDDLPFAPGHFLDDSLEPLLELAAELGTRDQRAKVKREEPLVRQGLRDIALGDPLGKAFHDSRFADSRLSYEDRVVLRPPAEHLHDAPDLIVPADDRVELILRGKLREVLAVLVECLVRGFRILAGDPLATADALQRLHDILLIDAKRDKRVPLGTAVSQHGKQEMLSRYVLVPELSLDLIAGGKDACRIPGERLLRGAICLRLPVAYLLHSLDDGIGTDSQLLEKRDQHAILLLCKRDDYIRRNDFRMLLGGSLLRCILYGILQLERKSVVIHIHPRIREHKRTTERFKKMESI